MGAPPGKLRIAFTASGVAGIETHPDCVEAAKDAAKLCAELGHTVEEAALPVNRELIKQAFMVLWTAGTAWTIDGLGMARGKIPAPDYFEPLTWALYEMGKKQTASSYLLSLTLLQRIARDLARASLKYDVWITPTLAEPPVPLGTFDSPPENPLHGYRRAEKFVPFTPICNITGQPAMSVPLYWNEEKLPVGTHFIGRFGDEATLFRLAAQLEAARPWSGRRPPVCA